MKKVVLCGLLIGIAVPAEAKNNCLLMALLSTTRSIQNISLDILGKVCTIENLVIDFSSTTTSIENIVIDILNTATNIEDIVIDILNTTTLGFACNATPISMPTTITESGPYCLTQEIMGDITIAADSVVLDLNGYKLFGEINTSSQSEVIVQNGFVSLTGVTFSNCNKVEVKNVFFSDSNIGISVTDSELIIIKECTFQNQTVAAITTTNSSNMKLKDLKSFQCGELFSASLGNAIELIGCEAHESTGNGFLFDNVNELQISGCTSSRSAINGFIFTSTCSNAQITNCIANNSGTGSGFSLNDADGFQFTNCLTSSNAAEGFENAGSYQNTSFSACEARSNGGAGFLLVSGGNNAQLIACLSSNNGADGFFSEGDGIQINDCVSAGNTTEGFSIFGGNAQLNNCFADNNRNGFAIRGTTGATDAVLRGCTSTQNGIDGFTYSTQVSGIGNLEFFECSGIRNMMRGFNITFAAAGALGCQISSCFANGNDVGGSGLGDGINVDAALGAASAAIDINYCSASRNGGGGIRVIKNIVVAGGVAVTDCTTLENGTDGILLSSESGLVQRCRAIGNTGLGISISGAAVFAYNNFAAGNGTNYSASIPVQVVASLISTTTGFWSNVRP